MVELANSGDLILIPLLVCNVLCNCCSILPIIPKIVQLLFPLYLHSPLFRVHSSWGEIFHQCLNVSPYSHCLLTAPSHLLVLIISSTPSKCTALIQHTSPYLCYHHQTFLNFTLSSSPGFRFCCLTQIPPPGLSASTMDRDSRNSWGQGQMPSIVIGYGDAGS